MEKIVQLLLPLNLSEDRIQLPSEHEAEAEVAIASLLLQVLGAEKGEEVNHEPSP